MTTSFTNEITLPVAEIFTSIHGEGYWAGTPMTFIRLAGCSVGKYLPQSLGMDTLMPILPGGSVAAQCTTFDGRKFPCDTDFHVKERLTIHEIYAQIPKHIEHVCITGGEPLMHGEKLIELCTYLQKFELHIETSGTIEEYDFPKGTWVTCSIKKNFIPTFVKEADEIRIMVDDKLDEKYVQALFDPYWADKSTMLNVRYQMIYFSPLCMNDTTTPEPESLKRCMELVEKFPGTRISIQMHKVLNVR